MSNRLPKYRHLCDHSFHMALSAIEVYNKPNFAARDQVFPILMTCAWESLLKAKLLRNSRGRMSVLYVQQGGSFKRKKTGEFITIGVPEAIDRLKLPEVVGQNIRRLCDVRDAATHLTAASRTLPYLVYTLGAASLRNYSKLMRDWFGRNLGEYDFYILPLGFSYPF